MMHSMNATSQLLPLSAMARRLHVTQKWLRNEALEDRIPCLRAGNRILFDPATVESLLIERAREGRRDAQ